MVQQAQQYFREIAGTSDGRDCSKERADEALEQQLVDIAEPLLEALAETWRQLIGSGNTGQAWQDWCQLVESTYMKEAQAAGLLARAAAKLSAL